MSMKKAVRACTVFVLYGFLLLTILAGGGNASAKSLQAHSSSNQAILNTHAATGPYGPDTCKSGYVWRETIPSDHVCVTPSQRSQAWADNAAAVSRRDPTGVYGSDTCVQGYVWREAFANDHVCVTPGTRAQVAYDNSQAQSRVAP